MNVRKTKSILLNSKTNSTYKHDFMGSFEYVAEEFINRSVLISKNLPYGLQQL